MKKDEVNKLKKKGWRLDEDGEKAMQQAKSDKALTEAAYTMTAAVKDGQELTKEALAVMRANSQAVVDLAARVAEQDQGILTVTHEPPDREPEKKQWEFIVERNSDGFISKVLVNQL